jgi:hypothetical protein
VRRDDERLADIIEAAEKIAVRAGRRSTPTRIPRSSWYT